MYQSAITVPGSEEKVLVAQPITELSNFHLFLRVPCLSTCSACLSPSALSLSACARVMCASVSQSLNRCGE